MSCDNGVGVQDTQSFNEAEDERVLEETLTSTLAINVDLGEGIFCVGSKCTDPPLDEVRGCHVSYNDVEEYTSISFTMNGDRAGTPDGFAFSFRSDDRVDSSRVPMRLDSGIIQASADGKGPLGQSFAAFIDGVSYAIVPVVENSELKITPTSCWYSLDFTQVSSDLFLDGAVSCVNLAKEAVGVRIRCKVFN